MNKSQAEAIAQAVLEPDRKAQEETLRKRAAEERSLATRRRVAWFVLAGGAIGAVVALLNDVRFSQGILWGGIAGAAIGWVVVAWRRHRAVTSGST